MMRVDQIFLHLVIESENFSPAFLVSEFEIEKVDQTIFRRLIICDNPIAARI